MHGRLDFHIWQLGFPYLAVSKYVHNTEVPNLVPPKSLYMHKGDRGQDSPYIFVSQRVQLINTCTTMSFFNKVFGKKEKAEDKTPSPGQSSEEAARKEEAERKKKIGRSSRQLQQALEAYPQIIYPEKEHLLNQPFNPDFIKKWVKGSPRTNKRRNLCLMTS